MMPARVTFLSLFVFWSMLLFFERTVGDWLFLVICAIAFVVGEYRSFHKCKT